MPKRRSRSGRSGSTASQEKVRAAALPPLTGIAREEVGEEVQSFVDSGVKDMAVSAEEDGTYTITPL